jgi:DNA-binding NarL/FixJ family response regulator
LSGVRRPGEGDRDSGDVIGVVLVDDDRLVRSGLRVLVDEEPDLRVVGEAADGGEAIAVCARTNPDVVLMDVRMPGMDGIEATRRLTAAGHRPRILVVTTFGREEYLYATLAAGASGFIRKSSEPAQLMHAIRVIDGGDALVLPAETRRLVESHVQSPARPSGTARDRSPGGPSGTRITDGRALRGLGSLTRREAEILRLIAAGKSNAEIAAELVVGTETVKSHVASVLAKIGVRDRTQAVIVAYETGFVRPPRP